MERPNLGRRALQRMVVEQAAEIERLREAIADVRDATVLCKDVGCAPLRHLHLALENLDPTGAEG